MAKKTTLVEIPAELESILTDFLHESFDVRQKAVQAGAEVFADAVANATPRDTGEMAQSWVIKTKYPDARYVGNTRTAHGAVHRKKKGGGKGEARQGVPLSNVLEYGANSPHYGFIRACFDNTEPQIYAAIKNTLNNGGN